MSKKNKNNKEKIVNSIQFYNSCLKFLDKDISECYNVNIEQRGSWR